MKKVLTILVVLALFAGIAFATDSTPAIGDHGTVTLTSVVDGIAPVFNIYHETTSDANKPVDSIAEGDITASFVIKQENDAVNDPDMGYSNYGIAAGTDVKLTVTCGPFKNANATSDKSVTVTSASYATVISANTGKLGLSGVLTPDANTVVFVPVYKGKRVNNQDIGTLTAKWAQDTDLPFGTYTADITLTYTAN